jgi:hypothetical protein
MSEAVLELGRGGHVSVEHLREPLVGAAYLEHRRMLDTRSSSPFGLLLLFRLPDLPLVRHLLPGLPASGARLNLHGGVALIEYHGGAATRRSSSSAGEEVQRSRGGWQVAGEGIQVRVLLNVPDDGRGRVLCREASRGAENAIMGGWDVPGTLLLLVLSNTHRGGVLPRRFWRHRLLRLDG